MQKPITVAKQEFTEILVDMINESKLPLIIIEPIIKNLLEELQEGIKLQTDADRAAYIKYLEEQEKKQSEEHQPPEQKQEE